MIQLERYKPMPVVKKVPAPVKNEKRGRGRPKGSKNAENVETLYTFVCTSCNYTIKSGLKGALIYCNKHYGKPMKRV